MPLNPVLLAIALCVGVFAAYLLYDGGTDLRTVYHVLTNDPVDVYALANREGPVEIEGTAVADDDAGTVTAPFTGRPCLAYEYEVEEYRSSGKHSDWETLDEGGAAVPFFVDDGSGRVRVEPAGAEIHLEDHALEVSPGDELPDRIARYVAESDDVEAQDRTLDLRVVEFDLGNRQRFTERRLDVDESVYVYGDCVPERAEGWGSGLVNAVIRDGGRAFVVSDAPERRTAWRIARGAIGWTALGLVALFVAVWFAIASV